METYQILGLIGSLLLIIVLIIPISFFYYHYSMMGYYGGMMGFGMFYGGFFFLFLPILAFILGIIGSLISDRTIAGVLLIIASIFSLTAMFLE